VITTFAPASLKTCAKRAPKPLVAPVMIAVCSRRSKPIDDDIAFCPQGSVILKRRGWTHKSPQSAFLLRRTVPILRRMQIDVISDTICPWCYIGKRRLERALALRPQIAFDVRWRPFQLDPSTPVEGIDRKTYIERKFGSSDKLKTIHASLLQ